jgi:cell division protein FtsL
VNNLLEREKLDKSKIREANTDVLVANGNLQMKILELEEKVKSLESKLSYSSQAKTEAVFRIEELTGEQLSDDKKMKLEMALDGNKIM